MHDGSQSPGRNLAGKKLKLLQSLLAKDTEELEQRRRFPLRANANEAPLSFIQQQFWLLDQWMPGDHIYNTLLALRLQGPLRIQKLERSLNEVIRRHEILRTSFILKDGIPLQAIEKELALGLWIVDLEGIAGAGQDMLARSLAQEEVSQPLALCKAPLLRATVLRLSVHTHILIISVHHIVCDGWSIGILIHEISTLYQAYVAEKPSPLPELSIQYADFATWQRQQTGQHNAELAYWRQQLAGVPAHFPLPTDFPRPETAPLRLAYSVARISLGNAAHLREIGLQTNATLFMVLLANFYMLLSFYTGQKDVFLGTPIARRVRPEFEQLIGPFINTLVLRMKIDEDLSFRDFLHSVRDMTLDAYAHGDVPFEEVIRSLSLERSANHMALLQVWMVVHEARKRPVDTQDQSDVKIVPIQLGVERARYDLKFEVSEGADGLVCRFGYCTDLFKAGTVAWLAELFKLQVARVVTQPDSTLRALLEELRQANERSRSQRKKHLEATNMQKLKLSRRKAVGLEARRHSHE